MLSRGQRLFFLAAAIAPAALPLFAIFRYGINMPYMDEWDFIKDLHLANEQGRLASHLFTQFNESRPALSRLLFLALAKISNSDFRAPMLASWFVACLTAWNLWRLAKPANDALQLTAAAFASLLIFSPIQYETWLWGNQVIVLLPMLFLTSALRILESTKLSPWISLGGALALGAAAMYSFSGGLFVLPAIAAALVFVWPHWNTHKRPAMVAWALTFAGCAGFYFYGYVTPTNHPGMSAAFQSPVTTVKYFLMFLGSVHGNGEAFVTILAGLALLATLAVTLRQPGNRAIQVLIGFVLVSAVVTSLGRVGFGLEQALSYRYMSVSLYFTVGLVALVLHSAPRMLLAMMVGALAATSVHGCIRGLVISNGDYRAKQYARTCVSLSFHTIEGCSDFAPYPSWDFLKANAPVMERLGLFEPGMFAGDFPPEGATEGTIEFDDDRRMHGKTGILNEPVHAILLGYQLQESTRWLGTAKPTLPSNGFIYWDSRLQIPADASEILVYRYNADSGKATFLAKAAVPASAH